MEAALLVGDRVENMLAPIAQFPIMIAIFSITTSAISAMNGPSKPIMRQSVPRGAESCAAHSCGPRCRAMPIGDEKGRARA